MLLLRPFMLLRLSISNYAIIDQIEIGFSPGFNVVTGETGAGKSIIMGAFALILGNRADAGVLRNREKKCIVEATFKVVNETEINNFLQQLDIEVGDEVMVRREVAPGGKSRAFINDTPTTISNLSLLGSLLVDLHRQFDNVDITQQDFQLHVLDAVSQCGSQVTDYKSVFKNWQSVKNKLQQLQLQKVTYEKETDFNRFLLHELDEINLAENELEHVADELKIATQGEETKSVLGKAYYALQESEQPIVQELKSLIQSLSSFKNNYPLLTQLIERLQSTQVELQEIAHDIDRLNNNVQYDPAQIERMTERLNQGYKLQKKHGVNSTAMLIDIKEQLEAKMQQEQFIDAELETLSKEESKLFKKVLSHAVEISKHRSVHIEPLQQSVNELLNRVGMPNARLLVQLENKELPGENGMDEVNFLFDANKTGQWQPLRKVASGGELSRLMLCIKSLVAETLDMPTLIFDEIDSGISGEAARQVGIIMQELALQRQIICITHQPQIAARGTAHYFVYKTTDNDVVYAHIKQLEQEERVHHIASMIGGDNPGQAAINNVREMMGLTYKSAN